MEGELYMFCYILGSGTIDVDPKIACAPFLINSKAIFIIPIRHTQKFYQAQARVSYEYYIKYISPVIDGKLLKFLFSIGTPERLFLELLEENWRLLLWENCNIFDLPRPQGTEFTFKKKYGNSYGITEKTDETTQNR